MNVYLQAYGGDGTQADKNNHANQMNSNNPAYDSSRAGSNSGSEPKDNKQTK